MTIEIHDELPGDGARISRVTELAFRDAPHTSHTEHFIVTALRQAGALSLSRVARQGQEVLGHVALSPVTLSDGTPEWYGLGPVSVLPEFQGRGIGSQLVRNALAALEARGAAGCVVLGEPAYYRRFGFLPVEALRLADVPPEYFLALSFSGRFPAGEVSYHDAFSAQA